MAVTKTTTKDGLYTVDTFTGYGSTTWTKPTGVTTIEVLVVAGGGGGGAGGGGGGGAGGVVYNLSYTPPAFPASCYLVVGAGGAGGSGGTYPYVGVKGSNSVFDTLTAIGGGYGGIVNGGSGGSGGGAAGDNSVSRVYHYGGAGTSGQGYKGGDAPVYTAGPAGSGGGGGIRGEGSPGSASDSGPGGLAGLYDISVRGTFVKYAAGGGGGQNFWVIYVEGGMRDCVTGRGAPTQVSGTAGYPNRGSGGGGGGGWGYTGPFGTGGDGSSGVVIVRYLTPATTVTTTRSLDYQVKNPKQESRSLDYIVKTITSTPYSIDYITKVIKRIEPLPQLGYDVKISDTFVFPRNLDYLVKTPNIQLESSLDYIVKNVKRVNAYVLYTKNSFNRSAFNQTYFNRKSPEGANLNYLVTVPHQRTGSLGYWVLTTKNIDPAPTLSYTVLTYVLHPKNFFNRCGFNQTYFNREGGRSIRPAQYLLGYTVKTTVQQTYSLNYDLRLITTKDRELGYQVYVRTWHTQTTRYELGYDVKGYYWRRLSRVLSYNVKSIQSNSGILDYIVRSIHHVHSIQTTSKKFNRTGFNQQEESEIYLSYMVKPVTLISRSFDYWIKNTVTPFYSLGYRVEGETIGDSPCVHIYCGLDYPKSVTLWCALPYPKIMNVDCPLSKPKTVTLTCRLKCG